MPPRNDDGQDIVMLEHRRLTFMIFQGGRHEIARESWRADCHDLEDVPEWAILWVLFKRLQTPSNRRPGPSIDHMVAGNAPWKGTSPPSQIRIEDPDTRMRRDDGTWRCRDKGGRLCPVTMHGGRIAKPRGSIQGGRSSGASRPS